VKIEPQESDRLRAHKLHCMFSGLPLAQHIASEWALMHLSALQRLVKPERTLEIGAGIGTITSMLLYSTAEITAVEPESQFREELRKNIGLHDRLRVVSDLKTVEPPFDLVVIDGEFPTGYRKVIGAKTLLFIEGSRTHQRRELKREWVSYLPDPFIEHTIKPRLKKKGCHIAWL
jgi:hypothetical protein